jgi:ribokinase
MNHKPRIVVVGSMIFDFVAVADRLPRKGETVMGSHFGMHTGGKGANQAVQAARLGADVCMVGKVGCDFMGDKILENLKNEGINTGHIKRDPNVPTAACCIHVDAEGNNDIIISPGANMTVQPADIDDALEEIYKADMILLQLEIPLETIMYTAGKAAEKDIPIILDPAPAAEIPDLLFKMAMYVTPNETEAEFYSGLRIGDNDLGMWAEKASQKLMSLGAKNVIITLGKQGAYYAAQENHKRFKTFEDIKAVDTTAAGDAFNGALAVALSEGQHINDAIVFANAAGSLAASREGAQSSLCRRDELEKLLSSRKY